MKRTLFLLLSLLCIHLHADIVNRQPTKKVSIVGGGIVGALEAYYAYRDAQRLGEKINIVVYEKGDSIATANNTSYNIVPSLTIDEILSVVPRGNQLVEKLAVLFSNPGGIRVDDVPGVNDSEIATEFKEAVVTYSSDTNHDDRTLALLTLGKKSMNLWQQMYDEGDAELKGLLEASNFNPCREPKKGTKKALHDGYRIDLIYNIPSAENRALGMKADYEKLGYKNCAILTPDEVMAIDPFLAGFCESHSVLENSKRVWMNDAAALWRPGGCLDTTSFLPKFYAYLKKVIGDCFQLQLNCEVASVEFDPNSADLRILGLTLKDGTQILENRSDSKYVFCPGESIGTLRTLGFNEPAYASFAGASLFLNIPLTEDQIKAYKTFSHCMEVHNEGICMAWQARFKENRIFIGAAGTKAFYGDKQPHKDEEFAKNRNLVQLNMIKDVLPEFLSLVCETDGNPLSAQDLSSLEERGIAARWAGRRAVAYDGFPTVGALYCQNRKVANARCTTHLGSGGVSFGPGAVYMSRRSEHSTNDDFTTKILNYADSRRIAGM